MRRLSEVPSYVALLRGINTGGKTAKKAELQACFEGVGLEHVTTFLQSGNVRFSSEVANPSEIKPIIELAIKRCFPFETEAQVYTLEHLQQIVIDCPFKEVNADFHRYVVFFEQDLAKALMAEAANLDADEQIALGDGVIYWRVKKGLTLESAFAQYLTKAKYKVFSTTRNLNTLVKVVG